jgi:hypothetical protein
MQPVAEPSGRIDVAAKSVSFAYLLHYVKIPLEHR